MSFNKNNNRKVVMGSYSVKLYRLRTQMGSCAYFPLVSCLLSPKNLMESSKALTSYNLTFVYDGMDQRFTGHQLLKDRRDV